MKKLILFILLLTGLTAQAQTNPDIWKLDLENRGYTVEETPRESLTLIVVKLSGDTVGIIESAGREGIYILRERLEGGRNLLPCITTAQRDTLTFKLGHQIVNTTNDSIIEYWNGSAWRSVTMGDTTGFVLSNDSAIVISNSNVILDTEGGVAADTLQVLTGVIGQIVYISTRNSSRDIAIMDADKFSLGANRILNNTSDVIVLKATSTTEWKEVSFSNNGN